MQRAEPHARPRQRVRRIGLGKRALGRDRGETFELRIQRGNARKIDLGQSTTSDRAGRQPVRELVDGGEGDVLVVSAGMDFVGGTLARTPPRAEGI